ncbi:single-stranded DNA-binding protein [Bradyrhizobium sp. 186]|uniref:single-stranded DNA-binding protein n=1 Tax=Bradyrhizobium sp. 186 TaxID=2782654 RepID=UPI002001327D|nr:single-stranded DNA-binding protein [Bradyrhizobium sp. 186]UPK31799.1 single-stranded DNA-binding protein [Bradyrhizobium sp. 186]
MAGHLNQVQLIGNVGADPEIKNLQNGSVVANFSIATSESWKDKATGEKKERTEWHRIVVWNEGLCSVIEQYVRKGSKVFVQGELQTRDWEKDGVKHYSTEVVLTGFKANLILLGDGGGRKASDTKGNAERPGNGYADATGKAPRETAPRRDPISSGRSLHHDDDIPF